MKLIFSLLIGLSSLNAFAEDKMTLFLKSCGYGTAAGALLGVASIAINENPNAKTNNIARGASLGLYLGIAYGLHLVNTPTNSDYALKPPRFWLDPLIASQGLEGAQIHWQAFEF